jgi:hypothetical protein
MVPTIAIVGLLIFIYFNRYVRRRHDVRRDQWRERREEQLERLLQNVRKNKDKNLDDEMIIRKDDHDDFTIHN